MAKAIRCRNCAYYKPSLQFRDVKYCSGSKFVSLNCKCVYFKSI